MELRVLSATSRPGKDFWGLSEPGSCLGETTSPKRDVVIVFDASFAFLAQASLKWVFGQERISPKQDNVVWLLF